MRIWSYLITRKQDQNVKLRAFVHLENRKTSTVLMRMVIVITVRRQCSKQEDVTTISVPLQEAQRSLTDQDIEQENKEREIDDMRREYKKEKEYKVEEMCECEWWEGFKTNDKIKNHVRTHFPYKRPLSSDSLLAQIENGSLFGYVQGNLVVPDELKSKFANFLQFSKILRLEETILETTCRIMQSRTKY